jgi:hypothetical protein
MSLRLLHRRAYEPVEDSYAAALRLAERIRLAAQAAQTRNDPASGANAGPGHERLEAAS